MSRGITGVLRGGWSRMSAVTQSSHGPAVLLRQAGGIGASLVARKKLIKGIWN